MFEKEITNVMEEEPTQANAGETAKTQKSPEKARKNVNVSIGLRMEASLLKFKKFVDNLVDAYSSTTNIEPHEAKEIVSHKAASFMEKGQYGKAIDEFNKLISLGKEEASIYYNLGVCCEYEDMDEEAENVYKKAIKIDKNFEKPYYRLGLLAIQNDDPKAAIKYLNQIENSNGSSYDIFFQLGVAYDKIKEYPKAIGFFKKAIIAEPKFAKTYKRLGYAYDAVKQNEDAVACFKKAMELEEI